MTIASHLLPRRRVLVLIGASVLLHYVAIDWAGAQLALPVSRAAAIEPPANAIIAALHAPPVQAPSAAAPAMSKPALRKAPPAARAPAAASSDPVAETGAAEAPPPVQSPASEDAALEAPPELAPELATEAAPEVAPELAAEPAPRYKVSLPPSAQLTLDVERTDAKGASWSGQAVMDWRREGDAYRMSVVASITMLVTINLVELTSVGMLGPDGINPRTMLEKRRNRAQTATHFNQEQGRITFSASQASHPLAPGAQDKATFPMQLAGIGRASVAQFGSDIELLVGEEKDASLFRFVVLGQEEIDTAMGRLATWRLMRPPLPGSYSSRLDVWLAPGHNWYPVQLRSTEANGAITTQTIRKIVVQ